MSRSSTKVLTSLQNGGLANRLFPWARASIYSRLHDYPMLGVRWQQLKVGPTLRREADSRLYLSLLQQRHDYVCGVRRVVSLTATRVCEPRKLISPIGVSNGRQLVVFTGLSDYFEQLHGHEDFLARELLAVTRPERLPTSDLLRPIVFHIRLGDFGSAATPLQWFSSHLRFLRAAGITEPIGLVSDGTDRQLATLTQYDDVTVLRAGSAIGDLWIASCAKVLVGSSHSTFSAWASFLGCQPTLFLDGGDMVGLERHCDERVFAAVQSRPSEGFMDGARLALGARSMLADLVADNVGDALTGSRTAKAR